MKPIKPHDLYYRTPKTAAAIIKAADTKRMQETAKLKQFQESENEKLAQIRALAAQLNLP